MQFIIMKLRLMHWNYFKMAEMYTVLISLQFKMNIQLDAIFQ